MSRVMWQQLKLLEDDYPNQPLFAQRADLIEINRVRALLDMPLVDDKLNEIGVVKKEPKPKAAEPKAEVCDHTEAREIYRAYLKKLDDLKPHQDYADRVARATGGPGQTPVRPLATMGTGGGPLLCDRCKKPIVLEGGQYHGVNADDAWARNPQDNWVSWILGGMVVEVQVNGTLRIYHGYPGRGQKHCCNVASTKDRKAREKFESEPRPAKEALLLAFFADEFPDQSQAEHFALLHKIIDTLYSYDPGLGVNRPATG
ncbi:MAG: hypothetical protein FJ304_17350 [Planctomycetes bacterium]|nr:hypothetical protein [Planctomycetota bacterium]